MRQVAYVIVAISIVLIVAAFNAVFGIGWWHTNPGAMGAAAVLGILMGVGLVVVEAKDEG